MTSKSSAKAKTEFSLLKIPESSITKVCDELLRRLYLLIISSFVEDELQNVEMAEEERTKQRNELKVKKRDYTGYDDEEFTEGQAGIRRSILAKYDEDLEGAQETVSSLCLFFILRISQCNF